MRPAGDAAGAKANYEIPRTGDLGHLACQIVGLVEWDDVPMTMTAQPIDQRIPVDTLDRTFAGRIDVGDDHGVGVAETGAEFLEQIADPRVAMGLHHGDQPAAPDLSCRTQDRRDLDRVVAIVIDDRDATHDSGLGEAPAHATELRQRLYGNGVCDPHLVGDGIDRQGVLHVVQAEHREARVDDTASFLVMAIGDYDVENRPVSRHAHVLGTHVGNRVHSVGDQASIRDPPA